jgi:hypothetical protein
MPVDFCHYLTDAILQIYHDIDYDDAFKNDENLFNQSWEYVSCGINEESNAFPEIAKHKPADYDEEKPGYWFRGNNTETNEKRIVILKQAVEEAKADYAAKEDFDANHWDGDSSYNE